MIWITGFKYFTIYLFITLGFVESRAAAKSHWFLKQLEHVAWEGIQFYDLVFPLFLFLTGITIPLSINRKLQSGTPKRTLTIRCLTRVSLLIIFGMIHQIHGLPNRWPSVLGFIGLSYLIASLLVIYTPRKIHLSWIPFSLIFYYICLKFIPFGSHPANTLTEQANFASFIDSFIIPAKHTLSQGLEVRAGKTPTLPAYDPEGPFMAISGSALAMLGVAAGYLLTSPKIKPILRALYLAATGIAAILISFAWSYDIPYIKKLWSPSFILAASGYGFLMIATFYLLLDVLKIKPLRWASFPLQLYGQNAIAVYMIGPAIGITALVKSIFSPFLDHFDGPLRTTLIFALLLLTQLAYLYIFHRKKIYLRV